MRAVSVPAPQRERGNEPPCLGWPKIGIIRFAWSPGIAGKPDRLTCRRVCFGEDTIDVTRGRRECGRAAG